MSSTYTSVGKTNSTFNQPRQKTWFIFQSSTAGWILKNKTTSFTEAQAAAKQLLASGYASIDGILVAEIVPIDIVMTPQV